jgi:hypothetical protein
MSSGTGRPGAAHGRAGAAVLGTGLAIDARRTARHESTGAQANTSAASRTRWTRLPALTAVRGIVIEVDAGGSSASRASTIGVGIRIRRAGARIWIAQRSDPTANAFLLRIIEVAAKGHGRAARRRAHHLRVQKRLIRVAWHDTDGSVAGAGAHADELGRHVAAREIESCGPVGSIVTGRLRAARKDRALNRFEIGSASDILAMGAVRCADVAAAREE